MAFKCSLSIGGNPITAFRLIDIEDSISYGVSTLETRIDNFNGQYSDTFEIGQEVIVKLDGEDEPVDTIFKGKISDIRFFGIANDESIRIKAQDFTADLRDNYVNIEIYKDTEVSEIVTDLIEKYASDLTTTNVSVTSTTLKHITFKEKPLFECLKELAELSNFDFYVDFDKDLNWISKESIASTYSLDNTNITGANFYRVNQDIINSIRVRGGTHLVGTREEFVADGGSVFTLTYEPHNTQVTTGSAVSIPKIGGVYEMISTLPSGVDYLVDYSEKKIIFISGTDFGDKIPSSGTAVQVAYDRTRPIIKYGQDFGSIEEYGIKHITIMDNSISNPNQATDIVKSKLKLYSQPKTYGIVYVQGLYDFTAGHTIPITYTPQGINDSYVILSVNWRITPNNLLSENVIELRVGEKIKDLVDELVEIKRQFQAFAASQVQETDVLTRLFSSLGSVGVKISEWNLKTKDIGSTYYLAYDTYSTANAILSTSGTEPSVFLKVSGATYEDYAIVRSGVY